MAQAPSQKKRGFLTPLSCALVACGGTGVLSFDGDDAGSDGIGSGDSGTQDAPGFADGADSPSTYSIGGMLSGVTGQTVLQNNGGDNLRLQSDGPFAFATALPSGATYDVVAVGHPAGHKCIVTGGAGVVSAAAVTSVVVDCATTAFTVGGTVSGLVGTVLLQNNGGDDLLLSIDGSFAFSTPMLKGATYAVTVLTQPTAKTCTVHGATGTLRAGNVTSVTVTCM